jgi:hypothetical protein
MVQILNIEVSMPIVDIELVCEPKSAAEPIPVQALADALGKVFASAPGRTWVRAHVLGSDAYAENGVAMDAAGLPAFVTILHARPPTGANLVDQVKAVTDAVAQCIARSAERVHVQYAPAAAGRQAFGGRLVE